MSKSNNPSPHMADPDMEPDEQGAGGGAAQSAQGPATPEAELPPPDTEQIVRELQAAEAKAADYWEQLMRIRAELENVQRRSMRDLEGAHKYAMERFLTEFLPVQDSLEMGAATARDGGVDIAKLREGMELTVDLAKTLFEKFNISVINPIGEKFNPEYHQAMATAETPGATPNTVVTVYQKGYLLADRLLRPALVVVAKGGEARTDASA